jgi:CheY-like chemotaxis protein
VTAYGDGGSHAEALAAGFDDYLVKPIVADRLIESITQLLFSPTGISLLA